MNTPIISPIWFYMMNISGRLNIIAWTALSFCVAMVTLFFVVYSELTENDLKKLSKYLIISLLVSGFLFTIIPSQDTMMKMLIAQSITHERAEGGKEMVKDTVDYIFEKIDESKKGE